MKLIRVAGAVLNQTPLDWDGNQARVVAAIRAARDRGVSVLCLPELCLCGYNCEDMFHAPGVRRMARRVLHDILPETAGMVVSVGLPVLYQNGLFNAVAMIVDRRVVGFVAKQHLAGEGIHYEPRWFKAWPNGIVADVHLDGVDYPIGDLFFDVGGVRIGFEVCEDAWVARRPGGELSLQGVDIILNPSASHFAFGKQEVRERFVLEGSRAFGVTYVYANLLGNEAGRATYDGGVMIASDGAIVARGPRFGFDDHHVCDAVIDIDLTRTDRVRTGSFTPDIDGDDDHLAVPFDWPDIEPQRSDVSVAPWARGEHVKAEEFTRAVTLALWDYMRKSRSRGFVVSLSGGADSAACACLVHLMCRRALDELGDDAVKHLLDYVPLGDDDVADARALTRRLLTCVYQSTRNSGETTRHAARRVSEAIGAKHIELDVDAQVEGYVDMIAAAIGRELTWETDDTTLQNIQARARGPGVWMLANIEGALLLATSNRSEAAVGYATMDGDTCGGLSPIAGIDKAFLRTWLAWLEKVGPVNLGPIAALDAVNAQTPTAELRPPDSGQTDAGDLMPYDLLDVIERAAIRDKMTPVEVYRLMRSTFASHRPRQLGVWIERFFRLWCRNQWKRERYAPSFHVDDKNLDPKTWCRFPILSGGFDRELRELREMIDREAK
ncbi:MAG: NAD+ synthetase [Phycisphaera sp.]|nr:NAD+ synthetase [Phycisphaera sp.]